jgi:hypothetical protein
LGCKQTHNKSLSKQANALKRQQTNSNSLLKSSPINLTNNVIKISGNNSNDSNNNSPQQPLYKVAH